MGTMVLWLVIGLLYASNAIAVLFLLVVGDVYEDERLTPFDTFMLLLTALVPPIFWVVMIYGAVYAFKKRKKNKLIQE